MHVHSLPGKFLVQVLKPALLSSSTSRKAFKRNLRLLHVCHRWRLNMLPLIYSHMYITYGAHPTTSEESTEDCMEPVVKLDTNLDLATYAECLYLLQKLDIKVHLADNSLCEISNVMDKLEELNQVWPWVSSLQFDILIHPQHQQVDTDAYKENVKAVSGRIANALPGVVNLDLSVHWPGLLISELYSQLISCYASRLQGLKSINSFEIREKLQCIKHIQLLQHDIGCSKWPCISPEHIEELELSRVPLGFQLSDLVADSTADTMVFPQLKMLRLEYGSTELPNAIKPNCNRTLSLPSLKSLHIEYYMCSQIFQSVQFPASMDVLAIQGDAHDIATLQNIQLPQAKHVALSLHSDNENADAVLQALCSICSQFECALHIGVTLGYGFVTMDPSRMRTPSITHLSFTAPTRIDLVLGAISNLPNLVSLSVSLLDATFMQSDVSIPEPNSMDAHIKPFNSKVQTLSINFMSDVVSQDLAPLVAMHLLLRLCCLTWFNSQSQLKQPITEFIQMYTAAYPHLSAIELNIK